MPKHWIEDRETIDNILGQADVGRLGTCKDGIPYITPVNFIYRDGRIYFHSRSVGRKLDNISANPQVCFEVDEVRKLHRAAAACEFSCRYRSVIAFGGARQVNDLSEKIAILEALVAKHAAGMRYEGVDADRAAKVTVVEIRIESITAKENLDKPGVD